MVSRPHDNYTPRRSAEPSITHKLLDQGTALQLGAAADGWWCRLHDLFEAANLHLLGNSRAHHRPRLRLVWMASLARQRREDAIDRHADIALDRIPACDEHGLPGKCAKIIQRHLQWPGCLYLACTRHLYRRRTYTFMASLPAGRDHGVRNTGHGMGRKFGVAAAAGYGDHHRICHCDLVALA